jgi:hypothetical protein
MTTYVETPITFGGQSVPALYPDFANGQLVAYTGTAAQSTAIAASMVILSSDKKCWFKVGANPTATAAAGSQPLPAETIMRIGIRSGDKISVIQDSAGGSLSIMPALSV